MSFLWPLFSLNSELLALYHLFQKRCTLVAGPPSLGEIANQAEKNVFYLGTSLSLYLVGQGH